MNYPPDNATIDDLVPWSQAWFDVQRKLLGETTCRRLGIYAIPETLVLSVVMPFFNEADTLKAAVERVAAVPINKEIILVDDGSDDGSSEIASSIIDQFSNDDANRIQLIVHDENSGKGAALKTGFKSASGDIVVVQDADLEYDPSEFPRLIQPIIEDNADVVYGSRFLGDHPHRVSYFWHYVGNRFLTTLSNMFTNLKLTDIETCYKVFRSDVVNDIGPELESAGFGVEPEITARLARNEYRIYEIPISYEGRSFEEGKKIGWRDGFKAIWCIIRLGIFD